MKNQFLAFILAVAPIASSSAQINLGAKGGVNVAKWIQPKGLAPGATWSTITGASADAFINYELSEIFAIQFEAGFIQKGLHSTFSLADTRLTINMVEFPIFLRANLPLPLVEPYVLAGIGYGIVLQARAKGTSFVTNQPFDLDYKSSLRKDDITAQFAAGGEYCVAPTLSLLFEVRFSVGIRTIDTIPDATAKTWGIQIQTGVVFNIL